MSEALFSCSTTDVESNIGDEIQEQNTKLEDGHPGVVKHVELLNGKTKPSAVQQIHPIVRQHEEQEPH
jgi:hypothetical protein